MYHPLWEPEKALNLLQPCSPQASGTHGNDRTCSPAPGLPRTLSPLISDPRPILGPFFSLIQRHILDCLADFLFPPLGWPGDTLRA